MKTVPALLVVAIVQVVCGSTVDFGPAPGSPLTISGGGHSLVVGDLNGDRKPDILVVGKDSSLHVLLGDGRGHFARVSEASPKLPHGAGEMVLADFNHDGVLDWAGAHHDYYDVIVMLGKGDGSFAPGSGSPFQTRKGQHPHTHALATGDLNGDGHLDLVTANNSDNDISVLLGDGKGAFKSASFPFPVGPSPYPLALADVNGDGKLDIVVPNSGPDLHQVTILLGDGRGGFQAAPKSPFQADGGAYFVAVADLNGDRKPDIVASHNEDSRLTVLLGDGHGDFKHGSGSPFELGNRAWGVVVADLNRDGAADIGAAAQNGIAVLLGDGAGSFKLTERSPFPTGKGSWRLELADFNGDGRLDLAAGNVESDDISVLLSK